MFATFLHLSPIRPMIAKMMILLHFANFFRGITLLVLLRHFVTPSVLPSFGKIKLSKLAKCTVRRSKEHWK